MPVLWTAMVFAKRAENVNLIITISCEVKAIGQRLTNYGTIINH